MAGIDIIDETFVAAEAGALAARLTAQSSLAEWFPSLRFTVFMDRAEKGCRWSIAGDIDGSMEVWLEPMTRGTLVHWFVRGELTSTKGDMVKRYVEVLNARMFAFKDEAERGSRADVDSPRG